VGLLKWKNEFGREALDVFRGKEAERAKGLIESAVRDKYGKDSAFNLLTYPGGAFTKSIFEHAKQNLPDIGGAGTQARRATQKSATGGFKSLLKTANYKVDLDAPTTKKEWGRVGSNVEKGASFSGDLGTGSFTTLFGDTSVEGGPEGKRLKSQFDVKNFSPYGLVSLPGRIKKQEEAYREVTGDKGGGPLQAIREARAMGREGYTNSNLPVGAQVAGQIALDPLTWVGPGLLKAPLGAAATKPGLTGKLIRGGAELVGGFDTPKGALGFAAGAGAFAEGIDRAPIPEQAKPFANMAGVLGGGLLGLRVADKGLPKLPTKGGFREAAGRAIGAEAPVAGMATPMSAKRVAQGTDFPLEPPPPGQPISPYRSSIDDAEAQARVKEYVADKDAWLRGDESVSPFVQQKGHAQVLTQTRDHGVVGWGKKTPEQWAAETERTLSREEIDAAAGWYPRSREPFSEEFGPQRGPAKADSHFASQVNTSVEGGVTNVLRVGDQEAGFARYPARTEPGGWKSGYNVAGSSGVNEEAIRRRMRGQFDLTGMSRKITDYDDSGRGKTTRTWMGDDPRAGGPFAGDVWQLRDAGYIDPKAEAWILQQTGAKNLEELGLTRDFEGLSGPSERQFEMTSIWGNDLTQKLNGMNWLGRSDWTTQGIQAVGWTKVRKMFGAEGGTMDDAFRQNTKAIAVPELPDEEVQFASKWLAENMPNVVVRNVSSQPGQGTVFEVLASPEAALDVANSIGYLTRSSEVFLSRKLKSGKYKGWDISAEGVDEARMKVFVDALKTNGDVGRFVSHVPGDVPTVRITDVDRAMTAKARKQLEQAFEDAAIEAGIENLSVSSINLDAHLAKGGTDGADYLGGLRARGRESLADQMARTASGGIGDTLPADIAAKPGRGRSLLNRAKSAAEGIIAGESPAAQLTTNAQPGETLLHGTTREFEGLPTEGYSHVTGENAPFYTRRPDVVEQFSTARGPGGRVIEATPNREMSFLDTQGPVTTEEMGDLIAATRRVVGEESDELFRLSQTSDEVPGYEVLAAIREQVGDNTGKVSEILREAGFDGIDGETLAEGFTSAGMQVTNREPGLLSRLGTKALGSEAPAPRITEEISSDTILHHGTAREYEGLPTGDRTRVNAIGAKGPYYTRDAEVAAKRAKENVAFGENKPRVIEAQPERPLKAVKYSQPLTRAEAEVLDEAIYSQTGYYQSLSPDARRQWDSAISIASAGGLKFSRLLSVLKGELDEDQITGLLRRAGWDAVDAEGGSDALMGIQILDEGTGPMRPRSILDQAAEPPIASVGERRARMAGGGSLGKDWVRMSVDEIGEALGKDVSTVREAVALERQGLLDKEAIGALQLMRKQWAAEYVEKFGGQPVRAYKAGTRAARYEAIDDIAAMTGLDPDAVPAGAYPAEQSARGRRKLEEILEVPAPHERAPETGAAGGVAGVGNKGNIASVLTGTYFGKTPAQIAARGAFGAVESELDEDEKTNWMTGLAGAAGPGAATRIGLRTAARLNGREAVEAATSDTLLGVKGGMGERGKQQFEEGFGKSSGKDPTGGLLTPKPVPEPKASILKGPMTPEAIAARSAKAAVTRAANKAAAGPPEPKLPKPVVAKAPAATKPEGTPPKAGTIDAKREDALKQLGKEPNIVGGVVNAASAAADAIRTVTTVGDLGIPLIQGWNMLTNPFTTAAWARGVARGIRSSLDPQGIEKATERVTKRIEDAAPGQDIAEKAKVAGFQIASPGQNKFARTGDLGGEGAILLEKAPLGVGKFFRMSRTQFEVMGTEWRGSRLADLLSSQIARNVAKGEGETITDEQLAEMVKVVNHATGTVSPSSGAASPLANALLFAPRFLSSQFALIGDAFHGGLRGSTAREHLMWGFADVTALTMVYNGVTTGEPFGPGTGDWQHAMKNWDETIRNPNFMKFKVGDAKLSAYGPLDSLGRMFAKEMGTAYMVSQGDAGIGELKDAPMAYVRGKFSPALGLATDVATGTTAIGKTMTKEDALARMMPITGQNIYAALRGEDEWASVAAEYFGFKASAVSDTDKLRAALQSTDDKRLWVTDEATGEQRPPRSIGEVPRDKRAILKETMPEYSAWLKSKDAGREIAPDRIASDANKAAQQKDDSLLMNGGPDSISFAQWRDRYVNGQKRARAQEEALRGDKKYPDPTTREGKDVQKYFELFDRADIQNTDGTVDGEAFQIALDALRTEVGEERWKKLDATVSYNDSATVRQYKADMRAYGEFLDTTPKYKGISAEDTREVDKVASRVKAVAAATGYSQKSLISAVIKEEGYDPALKSLVTKALARGYSTQYEKWRKTEDGQKSMRWFSNARMDDAERYVGMGRKSTSGSASGSSTAGKTRSASNPFGR
jgi:hypothetical protein